jgi:Mg-chelatase subunit ChlD
MAASRIRQGKINTLVIDTDARSPVTAARELARLAGGEYVRLSSLDGGSVSVAVRDRLESR